uniref:Proteasome subunit beta n=1 Tax=Chromera velia CCMP2878 TaxID=1169474 RepID=A0A0G4IAU6_9ALVE|mmetsp:Transcript_1601/g.3322  ORF Transcript_1601/g.3322 Transcript_1601/m.3322 type:complete len:244 (+) Transcript_1601:269-1000(+)|eukprot:Cvel_12656.t1-p1 / transcript=Cvel_12656.t1 / gene=Cvel_12656 / organism=Chromera_velia_CCMP2878 / gene_product=Proteasome subunit beta type-1, putative / transcript_product=Proteasome subunit beta type-1, putative / location=Cvel_scaffold836:16263-20585(+) / protein_length=243 / sequence_SO=supercontig / SO=protein_coding / is_pseudo=false
MASPFLIDPKLPFTELHKKSDHTAVERPIEHRWSPYQNNGGTALGIAGDDFAVVVADTRTSTGYAIHTRNFSKVTKLTSKCIIATSGMQAEAITLHRLLQMRIIRYQHAHRREPSVPAVAQLLSTTLYNKRFFPFYTFNLVAGVDDQGKGCTYGYDAIGSFEPLPYVAQGTGSSLVTSVLDNQLGQTNRTQKGPKLSKVEMVDLAKDVITSAGERDIYTGDAAEVYVIDASGVHESVLELKKD